eukprot:Rhum_TRINITY_DN14654_c2_g1::Rhum_TRINITY_DN14654_c2_g1_i1::g.106276::m.106276/K18740/EXD1, EGL; exonuclease 3'-5' domain-containing protein 1
MEGYSVVYMDTAESLSAFLQDHEAAEAEAEAEAEAPSRFRIPRNADGVGVIAVDCEGANFGRAGSLETVQLATRDAVAIVDVARIGAAPCAAALRRLLEDDSVEKLMWDCRVDADVLRHLLGVRLRGVVDLQLADALYAPDAHRRQGRLYLKKYSHTLRQVRGLKRCLAAHAADPALNELLEHKSGIVMDDVDWTVRPFAPPVLAYAAADVVCLLRLAPLLRPEARSVQEGKLREASRRYSEVLASMATQTPESLSFNHNIIPLSVVRSDAAVGTKGKVKACRGCLAATAEKYRKVHCQECNGYCFVCQELFHRSLARRKAA